MRQRLSLLHVIYSHRTIRKFRKSQISENVLKIIVEAGQRAPCYYQTYSIIWIRDEERVKVIAETCEDDLTKSMLLNSAALLLICIDFNRFKRMLDLLGHHHILREDKHPVEVVYALFEAGLVAENICLAAEVLGYGTALVSYALLEYPTVIKVCKLPQDVVPLIFICIGERAENPPPRPRWPMDVVLHENEYKFVSDEVIKAYIEEAGRIYAAEGYLRKYANWHGSYENFLREQTVATKELKKFYDNLTAYLRHNRIKI